MMTMMRPKTKKDSDEQKRGNPCAKRGDNDETDLNISSFENDDVVIINVGGRREK
jgi:hypothetical protein